MDFIMLKVLSKVAKESSIMEKGMSSNTACGNRSGEFKDHVW
jgi:hypothetical protein